MAANRSKYVHHIAIVIASVSVTAVISSAPRWPRLTLPATPIATIDSPRQMITNRP